MVGSCVRFEEVWEYPKIYVMIVKNVCIHKSNWACVYYIICNLVYNISKNMCVFLHDQICGSLFALSLSHCPNGVKL